MPPLVSDDPLWSHFQPKSTNGMKKVESISNNKGGYLWKDRGTTQDGKMTILSAIKSNQYVSQPGTSLSSSTESILPPVALSHWEFPTR